MSDKTATAEIEEPVAPPADPPEVIDEDDDVEVVGKIPADEPAVIDDTDDEPEVEADDGPQVIDDDEPNPGFAPQVRAQGAAPMKVSGKPNPRAATSVIQWQVDFDAEGDGNMQTLRAFWADLSPQTRDALRKDIKRITANTKLPQ